MLSQEVREMWKSWGSGCVFPLRGGVVLPSTTLRGGGISELSNLKPWLKPETTEIPEIKQP